MNEQTDQHTYEILVDGTLRYTGDDWREKFVDLSNNPENGAIAIFEDGSPLALVGPVNYRQRLQPS